MKNMLIIVFIVLICNTGSSKWGVYGGVAHSISKPDDVSCLDQLSVAPGCYDALKKSAVSKKIIVGRDCCDAVYGLSEDCFNQIFSTPPLTVLFGKGVLSVCDEGRFHDSKLTRN